MTAGQRWWVLAATVLALTLAVMVPRRRTEPAIAAATDESVLVTAYCNCAKCCGYVTNAEGTAFFTSGPLAGRPKRIGQTASGRMAHLGTLASDWKVFPPATRLFVPGYGTGVVEDTGRAVSGRHIDVWMPTHDEARRWGARRLEVRRLGP